MKLRCLGYETALMLSEYDLPNIYADISCAQGNFISLVSKPKKKFDSNNFKDSFRESVLLNNELNCTILDVIKKDKHNHTYFIFDLLDELFDLVQINDFRAANSWIFRESSLADHATAYIPHET
ncbi:MAG: hypothetical protein ACRC5C_14250, partial [Bacilli bacterium]